MSFDQLLTKVFGSSNQRFLKSIQPLVDKINSLESSMKALSDDDLRAKTAAFKEQVQRVVADAQDKEERKVREREALDEILPEAFAVVREASVRTTGMNILPRIRTKDLKNLSQNRNVSEAVRRQAVRIGGARSGE